MIKYLLFFYIFVYSFNTEASIINALRLANMLPKQIIQKPKELSSDVKSQSLVQQFLKKNSTVQGIIPVPVLQQGTITTWPAGIISQGMISWDLVKTDDGANCGYHALKNVILFMNALQSKNDKFLQDLTSAQMFFAFMKVWVPMIGARVVDGYGDGLRVNWLSGDEIERNLISNLYALRQEKSLESLNLNLSINIVEWKGALLLDQVITDNVLSVLANPSKKLLGFVWNDTGSHWIGLVLDRSNEQAPKVYYLDSINSSVISTIRKQKIQELILMTPDRAQVILQEYQAKIMHADLDKMEQDLDIVTGRVEDNTWIYSTYIGCCLRNNPVAIVHDTGTGVRCEIVPFSLEDLKHVGFAKVGIHIEEYVSVLNDLWVQSLSEIIQHKENPLWYVTELAKAKSRQFDIWYDGREYVYIVMDQCHHRTDQVLVVRNNREEWYVDPVNQIHSGFTKILVSWKNYKHWDAVLCARVQSWLERVVSYLDNHKELRSKIDWTAFGNVPHQIKFTGFSNVFQAVRKKIEEACL